MTSHKTSGGDFQQHRDREAAAARIPGATNALAEREAAAARIPGATNALAEREAAAARIPGESLLRLKDVLKIVPVSASTWWSGVKAGAFPQPVKLSKRVTAWRKSEVNALMK